MVKSRHQMVIFVRTRHFSFLPRSRERRRRAAPLNSARPHRQLFEGPGAASTAFESIVSLRRAGNCVVPRAHWSIEIIHCYISTVDCISRKYCAYTLHYTIRIVRVVGSIENTMKAQTARTDRWDKESVETLLESDKKTGKRWNDGPESGPSDMSPIFFCYQHPLVHRCIVNEFFPSKLPEGTNLTRACSVPPLAYFLSGSDDRRVIKSDCAVGPVSTTGESLPSEWNDVAFVSNVSTAGAAGLLALCDDLDSVSLEIRESGSPSFKPWTGRSKFASL
ncbi:hypothetical protein B0H17DRAFT_1139955 [Mycena rosella]|uniref:Uncharacterized protein n=1 Tax=Mycena rosella TaxID=1033263 RepID=A0AAD7D3H5_MYCRO|nr:hypothetical protein B0H17DRAFT_1139955 [Mycena rosella]